MQTSKIGNSIRLVADLVKVAIVHSDNEAWIIQQVAQNQADMRVAVQAERRLLSTIAVDTTTLADFKFECSKAQLFYMTANNLHGIFSKWIHRKCACKAVWVALNRQMSIVVLIAIQVSLQNHRFLNIIGIHVLQESLCCKVLVAIAVWNELNQFAVVPNGIAIAQSIQSALAVKTSNGI